MKKYLFFLFILVVLACNKTVTQNSKTGEIPLKFSLKPAYDMGYNVTRVVAILSKDNYTDSLNLAIEGDSAGGTFYNLSPGIYNVDVKVYDNDLLIAEGSETVEVVAGETTTVHITLELIGLTGNLEIIVDWIQNYDIPDSILFVGNSYTYSNGGIDMHFKRLVESAHPEIEIKSTKVAYFSYTLEDHVNNQSTIATITHGGWDYVVLQECNMRSIEEPDSFYYYAAVLDTLIKDSGSKTAFFMTWSKENDEANVMDSLAMVYNYIGKELNDGVVPIGRAFEKALQEEPSISLYATDQINANSYGTYLAVCTFYSFFFNESPVGIEYSNDANMTADEKEFLQYIAWKTYTEYKLSRF